MITAPDLVLAPYVKQIWTMTKSDFKSTPHNVRIFADGCPGLMFTTGSTDIRPVDGLFLYGQTITPLTFTGTGTFSAIVVVFYPHVLKSLFGISAVDLTDSCIKIEDLPLKNASDVNEKLRSAYFVEERVAILKQVLADHVIAGKCTIDNNVALAVDTIVKQKGSGQVMRIAERLNLSERTFERRFEQNVGVGPKTFANICRFRSALCDLRSGRFKSLTEIAFENGFADQSHFIRSFKKFSGKVPGKLLSNTEEDIF
jgi:AraC-like DNA-binding protein